MRPRTNQTRELTWDEAILEEMIARLSKHRRHVAQELGRIDRFLTEHRKHCYSGPGCPVCQLRKRHRPGALTRPKLVVSNKSAVGKKSEPKKPQVRRRHFPPEPPDVA
jgi:hypothetical protein